MFKKSFSESFRMAYSLSLVGKLGFYIAIPFIVAILGHNYLDKLFLDKYLTSNYKIFHLAIDFDLAFLVGVYSIWQIYKLILPFINGRENK